MPWSPERPVPRDVVLIGGGHSHVQVLRMQAMNPLPDARLTVIVDRSTAIYSGMAPGFVAGEYTAQALSIDVRPLARRAGVRFIEAACVGIDPVAKQVHLQGRPPVAYDLASLNVGSTVAHTDLPGVAEHALPTRPISRLVRGVDEVLSKAQHNGKLDVVVVGGGAGGVELAFCLLARLKRDGIEASVVLVNADDRLFSARSPQLSRRLSSAAAARGIRVFQGARVQACLPAAVVLESGEHVPSGLTVWVTGARAPAFLGDSALPVDHRGFVWVDDTLQVEGHPDLFAVGDCAVLRSWPEIPKAGVYAVRQGPHLRDNLKQRLLQRSLVPYRPQRDFLTLLNLGDGTAIGAKHGIAMQGRWVWRIKDWIDRRFMEKFQVLGATGEPLPAFVRDMPADVQQAMANVEMVCGGCAAKVAEAPLKRALSRLPPAADETVRMGLEATEDVAAVDVQSPAGLLVSNLDAFSAFTDDPWLVGRVGANNALSDLFATGVRPRYALALVTIPDDAPPEETLFQVMAGMRETLDAHSVTLVGGHTSRGPQLVAGLSVWGMAPPEALWSKGALKVDDVLVLTRGLGTGVLFHGDMAGRSTGPWMAAATASMLRGNAPASLVCRRIGVHGVTDVTGFGLAGHLAEMLQSSSLSATLELDALPRLPGAVDLLARGERSTFHAQNADVRKGIFVHREVAEDAALELIFDPQTAGGLLVGLPAADAPQLVRELHAAGDTQAAVIGVVTALRDDGALFAVARFIDGGAGARQVSASPRPLH